MNNIIAFASDDKSYLDKSRKKDYEFEKVYFKNSIPFREYDNYANQIKTFFGLYSVPSDNSYYPDLSITNDSDSIRKIYISKLNNMTINKKNYIIEK